MTDTPGSRAGAAARAMILPLALAQFIASYAATNMNVAISAIAQDLGTTVAGVQTAITLFTLTMAALMIPGSKLTDIWGRKRCFVLGLTVYAVGGLLAALAQGLPLLIMGYSLLEGVGSALMIPPIYILVTVTFPDVKSRARYFGVVSGAGGLGAAAGPLIGGLVTSAISWRASFGAAGPRRGLDHPARPQDHRPGPARAQAAVRPDRGGPVRRGTVFRGARVAAVPDLRLPGVAAGLHDRQHRGAPQGLDFPGLDVRGHRRAVPAVVLPAHPVRERKGRDVLLPLRLFRNKISNLGLGTQTIQWLILQGSFFAVSVYLQEVNGYNAIQTGLMLTPATIGILAASAGAGPVRPAASAAVADHRRVPGHRGRHDLAAGPGPGAFGHLDGGYRGCCCSAPGSGSC